MKPKMKTDQTLNSLRTAEEEEARRPHGHGQGTVKRIEKETGLSHTSIDRHLKALKAEGQVHIHCWTVTTPWAPVYVVGPGEDAPKPQPMSKEELRQRNNERRTRRRTEDKDERDPAEGRALRLTLSTIERARKTPQPWFAALPGAQAVMREAV